VTNSLAACFPEIAAELDLDAPATGGVTADQIVAGSHRRVGWRCGTCGYRWEATVGPPSEHQESGFPLGRWVLAQRRLHRDGKLPVAQADLLSALPGWVWDWREDRWAQFLTALRDFAAREGHLRVPQSHHERGYPLGQKVAATRMLHNNGKLARERVRQLEQLPGWAWYGGPPERRLNTPAGRPLVDSDRNGCVHLRP
jgi:hypothetical protein